MNRIPPSDPWALDAVYSNDINNNGAMAITGDYANGGNHACYYFSSGLASIQTVSSSYISTSQALNNQSNPTVVGYYGMEGNTSSDRAYKWNVTTGMVPLDTRASRANDINDSNQVVGKALVTTMMGAYYHATVWATNGQATDIDSSNIYGSEAVGNNANGQVVGWKNTGIGKQFHAFSWTAAGGLQELTTLEGGDYNSDARAVNDLGQIVGSSDTWVGSEKTYRAFLYENGVMTNLETLVTNMGTWKLLVAEDINNNGQIVGWGMKGSDYRAFLLTPIDNQTPTAILSAGNVSAAGANTHTFTVAYADNIAIKATTIGNSDVQVTGPNGFNVSALYAGINITGDGTPRVVTYRITPPGGTWDLADNGTYTISMAANQVADTANNYVAAGVLGTFTVAIAPPVDPNTQGAYITGHLPATAPKTGFDHIDVTFDKAIDAATFTASDISLVGPNGNPVTITGVSLTTGTTYRIQFASQTLAGDYTLRVGPDVRDAADHWMDQDRDGQNGEATQDVYNGTVVVSPDALMISAHTPSGDVQGKVSEAAVTFSDAIQNISFTPSDVTLNGPDGAIAITSILLDSGNTWKIRFPEQSKVGTYTLKVGPEITNALGIKMNQDGDTTAGEVSQDAYTGTFRILASALKVSGHSPTSRQPSGCDHADITFSEAIAENTFTVSDVTLTGPSGSIAISGIEKISSTKYRVKFAQQSAYGDYTLKVGPNIETPGGALMNQDGDNTAGENPGDVYAGVIPIGTQPVQTGFIVQTITSSVLNIPAGAQTGHDALRASYLNYGPDEVYSYIALYLSNDATVNDTDTRYYVGQSNEKIPVGAVRETSYDLKVPGTPGTYYLKYLIGENWGPLITLNVKAADSKPLIAISHLQASKTTVKAYEPFVFTMDITNQGPVDYVMDALNDQYETSYDDTVAVITRWVSVYSWNLSGEFEVDYIPAGGTKTVTYIDRGKNPDFGDSVKYYVKFISNLLSNVPSPYGDFTSEFVTMNSSKPAWPTDAKPDLICSVSAAMPSEATPGTEIPVTISVTNIGNQAIYGGAYVAMLRSPDNTFTDKNTDWFMIGDSNEDYLTKPLMPGASTTLSAKIVAPSVSGTYYYACLADAYNYFYYSGGKIDESNEANNFSSVLTLKVGNAQATADVTWPPEGQNLDAATLNAADKHYIEVNYAWADPATVNGDEISLSGTGAAGLKVGGITKIDEDTYRYQVSGDYKAGPVDVNIKAGTFENNSSEPNAADKSSFGVLPDISPFVLTCDTSQIAWDAAKQKFGYHGEASLGMKNASGGVDPLVTVAGDILYDDLKISLQNFTVTADIGGFNVPQVEGSFEIDVKTKMAAMTDKLPSEIRIAYCTLAIDNIEFVTPQGKPTQIELQGSIKFQPNLNTLELSITDPNKIIISPEGLSLTGGELKLPDVEFKVSDAMKFKAESVSIEYVGEKKPPDVAVRQPDKFILHGEVSLPGFYDLKVDLAKNDLDPSKSNYIEYSEEGVFLVGKISAEKMAIVPGVWELKKNELTIDGKKGLIQGDAELKLPVTSKTILCGLGFLNGELNYVSLGVDDLNIPIGTTPVFLQKVAGNVNNIAKGSTDPVSLGGALGLTVGPEISLDFLKNFDFLDDVIDIPDEDVSLVKLDLDAELNKDQISGNGELVMMHEKILKAEAIGTLDWSNAFKDPNAGITSVLVTASGQVSALFGAYEGKGSFTMDARSQFSLTASGEGAYKVPEFIPMWGGTQLASGNILVKYTDDGDDSNDFYASWGTLSIQKFSKYGATYTITSGWKMGFDGSQQYLGAKEAAALQQSAAAAQAKSFTGPLYAKAAEPPANAYLIAADTPWAILGAEWENALSDAKLSLIGPDGQIYDEAAIAASDNMAILDDLTGSMRKAVIIRDPAPGRWEVQIASAKGAVTNPTYSGYVNTPAPQVNITDIEKSGRKVTIHYSAASADPDARISLYFDPDQNDHDGAVIAVDLPLDSSGVYTWELTKDIPAGSYYIYAMAEDSANIPVLTDYWASPVDIEATPPRTEVLLAGKGITFTEAGGSKVTVKLSAAQGSAFFTGENIQMVTAKSGTTVSGQNLRLAGIELSGGSEKSSITVAAKGGAPAELGGLTGDTLGALSAKGVTLTGDIILTGSLASLTLGDIADGVNITAGAAANGFKAVLGNIPDADFTIDGLLSSFIANTFADGSLSADSIGKFAVKTGSLGADISACAGNILSVAVKGDITGNLSAQDDIHKITAAGDVLAAIRAGGDILALSADSLDHAILSAGGAVKKVALKGDILDSFILGGYDIGSDCAFGLRKTGGGDQPGSGDVLGVSAKGTFARSYIGAGVLPHSALTDSASLDSSLFEPSPSGVISGIKFGAIDYFNASEEFGLYAVNEIKPFKIGKTPVADTGFFVLH